MHVRIIAPIGRGRPVDRQIGSSPDGSRPMIRRHPRIARRRLNPNPNVSLSQRLSGNRHQSLIASWNPNLNGRLSPIRHQHQHRYVHDLNCCGADDRWPWGSPNAVYANSVDPQVCWPVPEHRAMPSLLMRSSSVADREQFPAVAVNRGEPL